MSCTRINERILPYLDGRLKEGERRKVEAHLAACAPCRLRVEEFRAVTGLLGELPEIEPSLTFDTRVRARVAAEPAKQSWWVWLAPSPRTAFAASMLLLATVWVASRPTETSITPVERTQIEQNFPVLENYDLLTDFAPLTELPQPAEPFEQPDDPSDIKPDQQM
jgi:anti-sigma factor RsiW